MKRRVMVCAAGLVVAVTLAACGSSGSDGSDTGASTSAAAGTTAAAGSGAVAEDKAFVAEKSKPPHAIQTPKLSRTPPTGKTVALVDCPTPGCKLLGKAATPAAQLLGWNVRSFNGGLTPETYVAGVEQAIQSNPDYLMITALQPNEVIARQIAEAEEKGIPMWQVAASDPPSGPIKSSYFGPATFEQIGTDLAKWVTADSDGKGKVVLFHDPSAKSYAQADDAFVAKLKQDCPDCDLQQQTFSTLNIGKSVPQEMVSYLQKNPDTQYVISTFSGGFLGVPQALKAAGLDKVKLNGGTSVTADYREAEQNPSYNVLAIEQTGGYYALDAFARLAVGDRVDLEPKLQEQFVNQRTVGSFDSGKQWAVPDLARTYADAWGVTIPEGFVEIQP